MPKGCKMGRMVPIEMGFAVQAEVFDFKTPTRPTVLSPNERRKREEAVRFANASVGLEGFKVSPEAEARAQRFINGDIDLAEFLQQGK